MIDTNQSYSALFFDLPVFEKVETLCYNKLLILGLIYGLLVSMGTMPVLPFCRARRFPESPANSAKAFQQENEKAKNN